MSNTNLVNAQAGTIDGADGKGGATLKNSSTSTVKASGEANAGTGAVPAGATAGSAPASATGATTTNTVIDSSTVTVNVAGTNQAPITVTNQNTRNVTDNASASATSGAAGTAAPAVTGATAGPVTTSNAVPSVTPAAVTAAAASASPSPTASTSAASPSGKAAAGASQLAAASPATASAGSAIAPAACAGTAAGTTITGSAEKKVTGPTASGQPIDIGIAQRASVTNAGSTTGAQTQTLKAPAGPAPAPNGASAKALTANNTVQNTALVDVSIGGDNHAPINIAVRTVTTIVNAAKSVVETAAGGGPAGAGSASGLGTKATNKISLDGTAKVDIAGDNHTPIKIVLEIGAELWNKGLALLGLGGGSGAPASTSATGLEVENFLKLLGRASVHIGGSNYAPIDIDILLQSLVYNDGVASAKSWGDAASDAAARVADVSSGPASCTTLLNTAGVANGQVAIVKGATEDNVRRQVLAGNAHVVDVQGYGTARCSTGDVTSSGGTASSGAVTVNGGGTRLTVVTSQIADTSAKTPDKPSDTAAVTQTVDVVIAVTATPVRQPGRSSRNNHASLLQEDWEEWVVVWEPLYVIYPSDDYTQYVAAAPSSEEPSDSETTTSMAGTFRRTAEAVTPRVNVFGGLDLLSQIQLALLGLLGFLLLALLKRRLQAAEARKAVVGAPQLVVLAGGVEAAAE